MYVTNDKSSDNSLRLMCMSGIHKYSKRHFSGKLLHHFLHISQTTLIIYLSGGSVLLWRYSIFASGNIPVSQPYLSLHTNIYKCRSPWHLPRQLILIFVYFTILVHSPHYFDYSNRHIHQTLEGLPKFPFEKVLKPEKNTVTHFLGSYLWLKLTYNY